MKKAAFLINGLMLSSFSNAALLHSDTHGFIIENQIETKVPKEQAWRALIDDVGKWWPSDHTWWGDATNLTINEFAGGCFCEKSGNNTAEHMRISFVDQYKLLRMTGGLGPLQGMGMYGSLDWSLTETDTGNTTITLKYTVSGINSGGYKDLAPIVDQVQAMQLGGLGKFLAE